MYHLSLSLSGSRGRGFGGHSIVSSFGSTVIDDRREEKKNGGSDERSSVGHDDGKDEEARLICVCVSRCGCASVDREISGLSGNGNGMVGWIKGRRLFHSCMHVGVSSSSSASTSSPSTTTDDKRSRSTTHPRFEWRGSSPEITGLIARKKWEKGRTGFGPKERRLYYSSRK
jgi:hypothetical protein